MNQYARVMQSSCSAQRTITAYIHNDFCFLVEFADCKHIAAISAKARTL